MTFYDFLLGKRTRKGALGELAIMVAHDTCCPKDPRRFSVLADHLCDEHDLSGALIDAFYDAWDTYQLEPYRETIS